MNNQMEMQIEALTYQNALNREALSALSTKVEMMTVTLQNLLALLNDNLANVITPLTLVVQQLDGLGETLTNIEDSVQTIEEVVTEPPEPPAFLKL